MAVCCDAKNGRYSDVVYKAVTHAASNVGGFFYDCATLGERLDSLLNTALSAVNTNHRLIACVSIDDQAGLVIIAN